MSTQTFPPYDWQVLRGSFTVRQGTDGWYVVAQAGGQQGPFDRSEDALQAAINAAAASRDVPEP